MKNYKFLYLILFFYGCTNSKIDKVESFIQSTINIPFESFSTITKNSIKNADIVRIYYPAGINSIKFCGIILVNRFPNIEYQNVAKDIRKNYRSIIPEQDSCNNLLPVTIDSFKRVCDETLILNVKDSSLISKEYLKGNISFFLIDNKKGKFLTNDFNEYYNNNEKQYHGYTSGVVLNDEYKIVVSWIFIK